MISFGKMLKLFLAFFFTKCGKGFNFFDKMRNSFQICRQVANSVSFFIKMRKVFIFFQQIARTVSTFPTIC